MILVAPASPGRLVDVAEIERITHPNPHLIARADRHDQKASELRFRPFLASISFSDVRTDGLACPSQLIGQHTLLDRREPQARPMDLKRHAIGPLKDLQVLERDHTPALFIRLLSSVVRQLSSANPKLRYVA